VGIDHFQKVHEEIRRAVMAGLVDVDLEKARIVPVVRQQMALRQYIQVATEQEGVRMESELQDDGVPIHSV
jgi:hypothetical protein